VVEVVAEIEGLRPQRRCGSRACRGRSVGRRARILAAGETGRQAEEQADGEEG